MKLDPEILEAIFTNEGTDLYNLTSEKPILLIFLRHFGCTFCREAMSDVSKIRTKIEDLGLKPVIVHMSSEETAEGFFEKYKLKGITHISDPDLSLYEYFGLSKGTFGQLYGLKVWIRGLKVGIIDGHGGPKLNKDWGDYSQMPGLFILKNGAVKAKFSHDSAAERPNYLEFIKKFIKQDNRKTD
jgi:peroxiredoxin